MSDEFQTHIFSYRHAGRHWQLTIRATDADDARARIGKLAYATYDGVELARIPAALAPVGLMALWARNTAVRIISRFRPPIA